MKLHSHVALAAAAATGCAAPTPPEVARSTPLAVQPPYALWWAATERCSGLRGDLGAVRWASVLGARQLGDEGHAGSWWPATNQITLAGASVLDPRLVRHEMLHALLAAGTPASTPRSTSAGGAAA